VSRCWAVGAATTLIWGVTLVREARAQVTELACSGTLRVIRGGVSTPEEPWTFSLIIDMDSLETVQKILSRLCLLARARVTMA
jgi:hypothetical protein